MPELQAYRDSLIPHRHEWSPLGEPADFEWCPTCGATRPVQPPDTD